MLHFCHDGCHMLIATDSTYMLSGLQYCKTFNTTYTEVTVCLLIGQRPSVRLPASQCGLHSRRCSIDAVVAAAHKWNCGSLHVVGILVS